MGSGTAGPHHSNITVPKRQTKLKAGLMADVSSRASISDVIARSYQEASDFLYDWRKAATRAVPDQRRTFGLAEN
jgi:hypothetical protein